jgi:hypothetical protein
MLSKENAIPSFIGHMPVLINKKNSDIMITSGTISRRLV